MTSGFTEDSIRTTSLTISSAQLCGKSFFDTVKVSNTVYKIKELTSDTILISSKIDSVNLLKDIILYPNPTDGLIILEFRGSISPLDVDILVYNTLGQLIFSESPNQNLNLIEVDLCNNDNGIYFVKIKSGETSLLNKKIVKML